MNFIHNLFEEFQRGIKEIIGDIPKKLRIFCIGSGANFQIHAYITIDKAIEIYEKTKQELPLGKKIEEKSTGNFILETFHTLESQTGYTSTFLFEISRINTYDPNDTLREWTKTLKKQEEFKNEFLKMLKSKK